MSEQTWQPIATAPEGESIPVWVPFQNGDKPGAWFSARWSDDEYASKPRPFWDIDSPFGRAWARKHQPTHWLRVPAPPETA